MSRSLIALSLIALLGLGGCSSLGPALHAGQAAPTGREAAEALKLARVLRDNGRLAGAFEVYQRLDQRQPLKGAYLVEYASVAAAVRPARETYALFDRARRDVGADMAGLGATERQALCGGLGRAALALGNAARAESDLQCALSVEGDRSQRAQLLNMLGVAQAQLGQHAVARESFNQALALDPGYSAATNNLALSWLAEGDRSKAIGLLNSARNGGDVALQLNLALAYVLDGHDDTARRILEERLAPDYAAQVLERFQATRQRIEGGAPVASELLAASQQPLQLASQD
ncbi:MAG: tetratricopeptide repeat protein [Candidatus Pseudomonas phytovorans]|uniref:Tetratricopeptide repeat protein n=1 Tax=Candidatus Pseudomonas phytovorans TaxID=3121377 RepID=A0AAJ6B9U8_9PSED|nr:tetratricopeptide repeat protein [Pseudomonas sp.]WEK29043.1 MAG: tetratricopeptide repeat protein [Pseudomonas sp.]